MHLFYTPDMEPQMAVYELNEDESKHCIRVLRMEQGGIIQLIDGRGNWFEAQITNANPKRVALRILQVKTQVGKRNHYLHVAVAPTKNIERLEWFLEKATEIGIDEVSLILCQRSERKEAKTDRLHKIITSAVKQSLKAYHPQLNPLVPLPQLLKQASNTQKFIAHCADGHRATVSSLLQAQGNYLMLIGPEGDFTPTEIELALQHGFNPVTLGDSRLRTETAALQSVFEINFLNR